MQTNNLPQILIFSVIFLFFIIVLIILFIVKSRRKIFDAELQKKELEIKFQKQIVSAIIASQETERHRIAQNLHDDISSKLIAVSLNLYLLNSTKTNEADKPEIANNTIAINQGIMESSRIIAYNLYPPILEKFGLKVALEELVYNFNANLIIDIKYENDVDFVNMNLENQLQLFRIIQELTNNSIKHGKASSVQINFSKTISDYICNYSDNGIGFDSSKLKTIKGLGFFNIESRIDNLQGTFKIQSNINQGFEMNFQFKR